MENTKTTYKAQALAIAMVVLVVSSIIGMAIYSRTLKDKTLTLGERASAEALEISDLILTHVTKIPIAQLLSALSDGDTFDYANGVTLKQSESEISNLFEQLGITNSLSEINFCQAGNEGNEYYLKVKEAAPDTYFEIRSGQDIAFPIKGTAFGTCSANIRFAVRGDTQVGFSVQRTYGKTYTNGIAQEYKAYEPSDVLNYCFSSDGSLPCTNTNFSGDWIAQPNEGTLVINLAEAKDGFSLDEIRIKAIGGTVGVAYSLTDQCTDGFRMIDVQAAANCEGVFRGKQILIPEKKWSSPIFDYVIFNGQGSL